MYQKRSDVESNAGGWVIIPCEGCKRITEGIHPRPVKPGVKTPMELCEGCPRLNEKDSARGVFKRSGK